MGIKFPKDLFSRVFNFTIFLQLRKTPKTHEIYYQ